MRRNYVCSPEQRQKDQSVKGRKPLLKERKGWIFNTREKQMDDGIDLDNY
jgi:hypothetical protein